MGAPSVTVLLVAGYAAFLLLVAWAFDALGARSAARSAAWRTGNFVYHDDQDAWRCHEDQWLWPASFDADKRVIRYEGQHAICGRCPAKAECSPTPGPREITRQLDPWPHSEAGRFHRGLSLCVAVVAFFLPACMLVGARTTADAIVLLTTLAVVVAAGYPLAQHLWSTPSNFPEHLRHEGSGEGPDAGPGGGPVDIELVVDRYATRWRSDTRRAPAEAGARQNSRPTRTEKASRD